jgi:hypothetical protein
MGGAASHKAGTGHQWSPQEARDLGARGGRISNGGKGKGTRAEELVPPAEIVTLGSLSGAPDIQEPEPPAEIEVLEPVKTKKTRIRKM